MAEHLYQIMGRHRAEPLPERKPSWLKVKAPGGKNYLHLKNMMRDLDLHTVCEEAHCPNVGECWEHGTATFMILGDVCTRNCAYCAVAHGRPPKFDPAEPTRVAEAALKKLKGKENKVIVHEVLGGRSAATAATNTVNVGTSSGS